MIRIVHISDTHNMHDGVSLPDGDVLVHSGDATTNGTELETRKFLKWLRSRPHAVKLFVPGNHDSYVEEHPEIVGQYDIRMLWDERFDVAGIGFYGSPYRVVDDARMTEKRDPKKERWSAFRITETWAEHAWREIPDGIDVLITHIPPLGVLDRGAHSYLGYMKSWGSKALLDASRRAKPRYHMFGHIHSQHGTLERDGITYMNGAICDGDGFASWKPLVIDVEAK